jgi:hypothetical protein
VHCFIGATRVSPLVKEKDITRLLRTICISHEKYLVEGSAFYIHDLPDYWLRYHKIMVASEILESIQPPESNDRYF